MDNKKINLIDKIINYAEESLLRSIIFIIVFSITIIALSAMAMQLIVSTDIESAASNDGWISFYGGVIGGVLGGVGTLIAVLISTVQNHNHQQENNKITLSIQEENFKQIEISNINEIIIDLREKELNIQKVKYILNEVENEFKLFIMPFEGNVDDRVKNCLDKTMNRKEFIKIHNKLAESYNLYRTKSNSVWLDELNCNDKKVFESYSKFKDKCNDIADKYINKEEVTSDEFVMINKLYYQLARDIDSSLTVSQLYLEKYVKQKYRLLQRNV